TIVSSQVLKRSSRSSKTSQPRIPRAATATQAAPNVRRNGIAKILVFRGAARQVARRRRGTRSVRDLVEQELRHEPVDEAQVQPAVTHVAGDVLDLGPRAERAALLLEQDDLALRGHELAAHAR